MDRLTNQQEAELIDGIYQDLENLLMQNIARHIRNYDQPIPTDEWLLQKLAEIGKLDKEHIRIISQMAGVSDTAVQRMLEDMAANTIAELEPGYQYLARQGIIGNTVPAAQSRNVRQVVKTLKKQAKDVQNLSNTTMLYKAKDAYKNLVREIADKAMEIAGNPEFIELMNEGVTAAVIGAQSRAQALRRCIQRFAEKGIPAFVDSRGREWTPEAYINMCMRTTSQKVATEIQMARADDHGIDLIEISSHAGARPRCAPFQGRIFDRANKSTKYPHWNTTSYGEPAGLFGINCGHHGYPYIEGVSIRRYFPTEDMDANDKLYKETQKQRALERAVRKQKRECMLYDELGDKEAFEKAAVKLKSKEAELKRFVDGNSQLHRRKDREQVVGFDKRLSAEAIGANKKATSKKAANARNQKKAFDHEAAQVVMSAQEKDEFDSLKKKYKSVDEAMLFGSPSEAQRYVELQKKQLKSAAKDDFKMLFENQAVSESTLNSWRRMPEKEEYDAISTYSRSGYIQMNEMLRHGSHVPEKVQKEAKALANYLDGCTIESDIHLKRGVGPAALNHLLGDGWKNNMDGQVGKRIVEKGFCSTTPFHDGGFADNVMMYIKAPTGTKGAYIKDYAANKNEKEFLLQHGTQFEVKRIEEEKNKFGDSRYIVHLEVIVG